MARTMTDRPDTPIAPETEARVQELLRRPYRMVVRGEPMEGYLAEAPELPGCFTAGETPEEAMAMLRDAMAAWLADAVAQGEMIPEPTVEAGREYSGKFVLRLPKSLHRHLAARAEEEGVSLNQLALACLASDFGMGRAPRSPHAGPSSDLRKAVSPRGPASAAMKAALARMPDDRSGDDR